MGFLTVAFVRAILLVLLLSCVFTSTLLAFGRTMPDPGQAIVLAREGVGSRVMAMDTMRLIAVEVFPAPPYLAADLPRLSPDGRRIVYELLNESGLALSVYDSARRPLYVTDVGLQDRLPSWSPDGTQLAFWSNRKAPSAANRRWQNWNFYVMDMHNGSTRALTDDMSVLPFGVPLWSPDSAHILLNYWRPNFGAGLYLIHVATGEIERVRGAIETGSDLGWSRTGEGILFRSNPERNSELVLMNIETGQTTNVTNDPANDFDPAWSPDGTQIAFTSTRGAALVRGVRGAGDIYVASADGQDVRRVTTGGGWHPVWSSDGLRIAFLSAREGQSAYYVVNADGTAMRRLANAETHELLGWLQH